MDCSFCEEVRRIPAGDFMFYTEAIKADRTDCKSVEIWEKQMESETGEGK